MAERETAADFGHLLRWHRPPFSQKSNSAQVLRMEAAKAALCEIWGEAVLRTAASVP